MAEITREQIALGALDSAINNCGFNPQRFAEATTNWHRYTQNELFKLALCIIRVYGSKSYRHDLMQPRKRRKSWHQAYLTNPQNKSKMTNINIELFRRFQPRKKLARIDQLNEKELFMITTDTVRRIIKEAGVRRKGSRGSYYLSLCRINITGNRWNSDIEGWGIRKNRLYIDFYLQYDNTDTTTSEHIGNFLSPGEFLGELHATDRHDNPRTYYFHYDTEDKARAIRALLRQYVENKYADKLKEEEETA